MDNLLDFSKIVPYLQNPLILIGVVLFLIYGLYKVLLKSGIITPLGKESSGKTVRLLIHYSFIIPTVLLISGFGFVAWKTSVTRLFPVTIYVHGPLGHQDIPLRNSGSVVIRLGIEPRSEPIGDDGQAYFPSVPSTFRDQSVPIWVESDEFETDGNAEVRLSSSGNDVIVKRKPGKLSGRVLEDTPYLKPIAGAEIRVAGLVAKTGNNGEFSVLIPGDRLQSKLEIDVTAFGHKPIFTTAVPNSNDIVIKLKP